MSPTLDSVRELSPNLENLFRNLDPLIDASEEGFPALERLLGPEGLQPFMDALFPFLSNLNPALRYLAAYRKTAADFLVGPSIALAGTTNFAPSNAPAPRHYLKQLGYLQAEALSIYPERLAQNRGNAYPPPEYLTGIAANGPRGIFPEFDCKNLDYELDPAGTEPDANLDEDVRNAVDGGMAGGPGQGPPISKVFAPCYVTPDQPAIYGGERAPQIYSDP